MEGAGAQPSAPQRQERGLLMLITIGVILVAMIAISALEIWLFWRLGDRDRRRSQRGSAHDRWAEGGQ